jgi:hypothetical protein
MIERRARWERALACTREQLVFDICSSLIFLTSGIGLRPRPSSALIVLFGFAVGVVFYGCIRLVLALPPLARRVDWESEPRLPSTPRCFAAGLFAAVLIIVLVIAVVYFPTDETSVFAFVGGMFPAYALITAAQRFYLERDSARRLSGR